MTDNFFEERKKQSEIKTRIVNKYFYAWSKVIIGSQKRYLFNKNNQSIAYIDLFSGPGKYDDGSESTPIHILKTALKDPDLSQRLRTIFNDKDEKNYNNLCQNIKSIPNINQLKYQPQVTNFEVGDEIANYFKRLIPQTYCFYCKKLGL